jgi:transposase
VELRSNISHQETICSKTEKSLPLDDNDTISLEIQAGNNEQEDAPGTIGFFFADECTVYQAPTKKKKLAKRGKTPVVKSRGGRKRQSILGVLSLFAATVLTGLVDRVNSSVFIGFLKALLKRYGHLQKIYLVIDNASSHRAKKVKVFLESVKDKLEVIFLPPYSPKLNPIEHFWTYMRDWITHNQFYPAFENLVDALHKFLEKHKIFNAEVLTRCCYY